MNKEPKRRKPWKSSKIQIIEHKIDKIEAKQLLTEIAELFYDVACQFQSNQKSKSLNLKSNNTDSNNIEVSV